MIRYYKLFDLLARRGMKKSDLRQILSSSTVAKLSKGEYISCEAIEKICEFLHCQPGDIMEYMTIKDNDDGSKTVIVPRLNGNDYNNIIAPNGDEFHGARLTNEYLKAMKDDAY